MNYVLLGEKLNYSISPKIHNFIYSTLRLKGRYDLLELSKDELTDIRNIINENKISGLNVTIPYKETIIDCLDSISEISKEIGAINCIKISENKLQGYNTDYYGVLKIFEKIKYDVKNKVCYILGSGGAAKSVIVALKNLGAKEIIIVSREPKRTEVGLKNRFPYVEVIEYSKINKGDVIINTTPVGVSPHFDDTPLKENQIKKFNVAIDLIYNPSETKFLKLAKESGLLIENGLTMLIEQAIKADEIWFEEKFRKDLFDEVYNYILEEKS